MASGSRPHILVVEDDPLQARWLATTLESLDVDTTIVGSAEDALAAVADRVPDVVLADYGLPGRNGFDLLLELGVLDGRTRRVLLTGFPDVPGQWGADIPVLYKPFATSTLRWLVGRLLAD